MTYDLNPNTPEWEELIGKNPIPETHEQIKDNLHFDYCCSEYIRLCKEIAELEKEKKVHADMVAVLSKGKNSCSQSYKSTKFKVKGSVDTKALYDAHGITEVDLDEFRKETREQWKISKT